jgi:hypothetical protein
LTFHPSRQQGGGGWEHHLPLLFSGLVQTPLVVALKMLAGLRSCGYREVVAVEAQRWRRCDCDGNGGACYPCMHTGISMIPVCIRGLHKSPFNNMTSRTNRETSSLIVCALCAPVCAGQRFYSLSHKKGYWLAECNLGDLEDTSIRETYWLLAIQAAREASRLEGIRTQPAATVQNNI